jgi:hypothetical protein
VEWNKELAVICALFEWLTAARMFASDELKILTDMFAVVDYDRVPDPNVCD